MKDIIDCLNFTRDTAIELLKGLDDIVVEMSVLFVDEVIERVREGSWELVTFDEFCGFLEDRKPKLREKEEEEKGGEEKESHK
jgi:uncharacterized protein YlzI (FlbEa/FlbD family)